MKTTKEELKEKAFEIFCTKDVEPSKAYELAYEFLSVNRDANNRNILRPLRVRAEVRRTHGVGSVAYFWYLKDLGNVEFLLGKFTTRYDNEYSLLHDSEIKKQVLGLCNDTLLNKDKSVYEDVDLTSLRIVPYN